MKNKIIFLFLFAAAVVQAQIVKDWPNAPLNPLIERYTLNHFNLKGNVAKMVEEVENSGVVTTYTFKDGKLLEMTVSAEFGYTDAYTYSKDKIVITIDGNPNKTYTLKDGNITALRDDTGSFNFNYTYLEGKLQSVTNSTTNQKSVLYTYDDIGRISVSKYFNDLGSRESANAYTYENEGDLLKIMDESFSIFDETTSFTTYVNKNGYDFQGEDPSQFSFEYDAKGNWTKYTHNNAGITVLRTLTYKR